VSRPSIARGPYPGRFCVSISPVLRAGGHHSDARLGWHTWDYARPAGDTGRNCQKALSA
jgi:hypothetical protein